MNSRKSEVEGTCVTEELQPREHVAVGIATRTCIAAYRRRAGRIHMAEQVEKLTRLAKRGLVRLNRRKQRLRKDFEHLWGQCTRTRRVHSGALSSSRAQDRGVEQGQRLTLSSYSIAEFITKSQQSWCGKTQRCSPWRTLSHTASVWLAE